MWFRLSGGTGGDGSSDAVPSTSTSTTSGSGTSTGGTTPPSASTLNDLFTFEKFRRASFRRKSFGPTAARKRSKSPHAILAQSDASKADETEPLQESLANSGKSFRSELSIFLASQRESAAAESQSKYEVNKKIPPKPIKTDPPKRRFYKPFGSGLKGPSPVEQVANGRLKTISDDNEDEEEDDDDEDEEDSDDSDTDDDDDDDDDRVVKNKDDNLLRNSKDKILLTDPKYKHNRIEKSSSKTKVCGADLAKGVVGGAGGIDSIKRSRSARKITKCSSIKDVPGNEAIIGKAGKKDDAKKSAAEQKKKGTSSFSANANLNLQSIVKFMMNNKFMNSDEFTLLPRKSISESVSTIHRLAMASGHKPFPIPLKHTPQDSVVAAAPKDNDVKAERNVVLVKKQNLKNSFRDATTNKNNENINNNNNNSNNTNNNNNNDNDVNKNNEDSNIIVENKNKFQKQDSGISSGSSVNDKKAKNSGREYRKLPKRRGTLIKRNGSNSSKSSGNFEDEAFYSCDEQEEDSEVPLQEENDTIVTTASTATSKDAIDGEELPERRKQSSKDKDKDKSKTASSSTSSSPSLTKRVAAKINETTSKYKQHTAANKKKRKTGANGAAKQRPELYKQISVERLSSSIVRQPSDRRPDKSNVSQRASSNGTHSSADLQSSLHAGSSTVTAASNPGPEGGSATDAAAVLIGAAGAATPGAGVAGGAVSSGGGGAGPVTIAELNAQDAIECSKDVRREILQQQHQQNKSAPVSVNRSESYKERLSSKRSRNSRRKTSDPSLTSRQNDDETDVHRINSIYTASSNSSLSSGGGSESPSTSMEQVGGAAVTAAASAATTQHHHQPHHHHHHGHSAPHHSHQHSHQDSFHGSIGGSSSNASFWSSSIGGSSGPTIGQLTRQWNFDSDDDDDLTEVDWSSNVAAEMLAALTDAEKKRQEIINEIYQTERSHVRTLKLLDRLFFCPLHESGVLSNDHLNLLFPPALISLRELHGTFEQQLKQRRIEHNHIVSHVGDLLVGMFEGKSGEELREFAAQFCARQQIALEALKEKRRKDEQLQKLLSKAESHKACRRLQLKDLLPTVLQRLTKYPLLFENLYKVTVRVLPENISEAEAIQSALESSKKILVDVNQAVKTAEDAHKLQNIQRKLDKSTFDKEEFKNLDLTQYRLIHDGSLTMKKNPSIQLHGLLFETMIVLLTKQDDKYALKYLHAARNTEVNNKPVSPIMSIDSETLVRQEAADKNSFFLIKTKTSQMLELRAPSSSECKTWFKHISDAAEQYKPRSKNANHEPVDDPAIATLPHSNTKESLELTLERPPPMAATATVTTTPLAPMMPPPTATTTVYHNNNGHDMGNSVQIRSERRESTPVGGTPADGGVKLRSTQNELLPSSVNRTMSTRSCGEAQNTYSNDAVGVTLRHTQSARKANESAAAPAVAGDDAASGAADGGTGVGSKRDSASIVYSNNSNNTRTFIQNYLPLVDPTAIRISISPAHTAEPVLTSGEKLRRLDASIRNGLLEKQKIICDMFRLPVEHFNEIVDIAAMPEAPKDSADIALAAYAQVQTLTEVLNEYMQVSAEQEVSAVSTTVCDQCHEKQRQLGAPSSTLPMASNQISGNLSNKHSQPRSDSPPPLPPPNRQQAQPQVPTPTKAPVPVPEPSKLHAVLDESSIHEDDDGYCEIDELRLPAITTSTYKPPAPEPSAPLATPPTVVAGSTTPTAAGPPELVKRQSTLSSDSIPEETTGELIAAIKEDSGEADEAERAEAPQSNGNASEDADVKDANTVDGGEAKTDTKVAPESSASAPEDDATQSTTDPDNEEHIEINEDYDSTEPILEKSSGVATVDIATQTMPVKLNVGTNYANIGGLTGNCGPNRIQHANSLEPSVPCHALSSIVSALNAQISLLLPKINDRDMERERLRKENQHLRELLNAMHERQRVEAKLETPNDVRTDVTEDGPTESANAKIAAGTTTKTPTIETTITTSAEKVATEAEN